MKIVVLEGIFLNEEEIRKVAKPITDLGHTLEVYEKTEDIEEQKERVKDCEILVIANSPLKGEVIRAAKNLKYLNICFTGFDHVDLDACKEMGVKVSTAAGYASINVAELVIGMAINVLRDITHLDSEVRNGGLAHVGNDLTGKTVGVVGTGKIGQETMKLLKAFDCNILGYDIYESDVAKELGCKYVEFDEILKESDLITIHMPLLDSTKHMFAKEQFEMMKDSAILINCARGPIVDNDALAEALENGVIAGAGIDVFDMEPPIPSDYKLLKAPNATLTPHIGFFTVEAMYRRADIAFNHNISNFLNDEHVNPVPLPETNA